MGEQLNTDLFVMDVLNEMSSNLTDQQMGELKTTLYVKLHDISLIKQYYDLAVSAQETDASKVEYFAVAKKIAGRAESSIKQYVRTAWKLRSYIGKNFEDITTNDVEFYLAKMQKEHNWKDTYTEIQRTYLSAFFSWLFDKDLIPKNPVASIEPIKCEQRIKRPYSSIEIERMRNACKDDVREIALIEFLYATGLRISNVMSLKWSDLDMYNRKLVVRLKGGKEKEIYFSAKSAYYLRRMMDQRMLLEGRTMDEMLSRPVFASKRRDPKTHDYEAISADDARDRLKQIGQKACVEHVHPHKFRRTFACRAINHGMPLEELKEHMGHANYDTTLGYASINNNNLEQSYRKYCD